MSEQTDALIQTITKYAQVILPRHVTCDARARTSTYGILMLEITFKSRFPNTSEDLMLREQHHLDHFVFNGEINDKRVIDFITRELQRLVLGWDERQKSNG